MGVLGKSTNITIGIGLAIFMGWYVFFAVRSHSTTVAPSSTPSEKTAVAIFAGGCFWCTESDFEKVPGVRSVVSGYTGGTAVNPSYTDVSSHTTGHFEAVQVYYNPNQVSYDELLDYYWRHIDPTDPGGQFIDQGSSYRGAIFVNNAEEKALAESSKQALIDSKIFQKPIVTEIHPVSPFYQAEEYHQDYYKKNPIRYNYYRDRSGRDDFLAKNFTAEAVAKYAALRQYAKKEGFCGTCFIKPSDEELRKRLTPIQYAVTQEAATEKPFENLYNNEQRDGIYVDVVSGEALFSSRDKFDSGTGWPSFTKPLVSENIVVQQDFLLIFPRSEVKSKWAGSHLGHVFDDGPEPTYKRYCMNSAALTFIPKEELAQRGYGEFIPLFN